MVNDAVVESNRGSGRPGVTGRRANRNETPSWVRLPPIGANRMPAPGLAGGRSQRAESKVGVKGRSQRSESKVGVKGQSQRSESKVGVKGRSQRSESKVRVKGQSQRSESKVGPDLCRIQRRTRGQTP